MATYQNILVAVDLSSESDLVLQKARQIAAPDGEEELGGGAKDNPPEKLYSRRLGSQPSRNANQVVELFVQAKGETGKTNTNYVIFSLRNKLMKVEDFPLTHTYRGV